MYKQLKRNIVKYSVTAVIVICTLHISTVIIVSKTDYEIFPVTLISLLSILLACCFAIMKSLGLYNELNYWYEQILDFVYLPISTTDMDMKWTFVNKPVKEFTGLGRKEALGKPCSNWKADVCKSEQCGICFLEKGKTTSYFTNEGSDSRYQIDTTYLYDLKKNKIGHLELVSDISAKLELDEAVNQIKNLSKLYKDSQWVSDTLNDINPAESEKRVMRQYTISEDTHTARQLLKTLYSEISERISTEKKLEENMIQQRDLLNNTSSIIYIIDPEGRYTFINSKFEKLHHVINHEVIGKTVFDITERSNADQFHSNDMAVLRSGKLIEFDEYATFDDMEHKYLSVKFPLKRSSGEIYAIAGISLDITDRLKLEEQIAHSSKMDAIGQLAGGVAHDFNNMLAGISGAAQLLICKKIVTDPEDMKLVEMILESTIRASELSKKLLTFSRKNKFSLDTIDITNLIDDVVGLLTRTIDKKILITFDNRSHFNITNADYTSLQNAFMNLAINASHAMPNGGTLSFSTSNVILNTLFCRNSFFDVKPGQYIEVQVKDTGEGINPDILNKIFEPFFTTKAPGNGTGLGLSSVYGTIQNHHGAISVKSELSVGTIFTVFLPCSDMKIEIKESKNQIIMGSGQILLIDDEDIVRETGRMMLEYLGFKVFEAANGKEGLEIFKNSGSSIDLVITDMIMPEMDGREVFFKMKEIDENCKIIVSSGFTSDESLETMKDAGLSGFIKKPFREYELSQLISSVLAC